jgi:uncharacterized protein YjbI with pentapeptide repeats
VRIAYRCHIIAPNIEKSGCVMVGRVLRIGLTVLVVALGLLTPILATAAASPASANTVFDGCTIVSNPSPTNFTDCPNGNLAGADLEGADLAYADLAGASFVTCPTPVPGLIQSCTTADLTDANLTQANLSGAVLYVVECACQPEPDVESGSADLTGANLSAADLAQTSGLFPLTGADLSGANLTDSNLAGDLTNANLTGANLSGATFSYTVSFAPVTEYATLTGANFTGTILVPSNQNVTATSQAGAVATWSTPAGIPGASPGSCTPASGSTFPLFSSTVSCRVLDADGDVATGTFQVYVEPTTQYFTRVFLPSDDAVLSGAPYLDAGAADAPGVTKVVFELSGGTYSDQVVATGSPTLVGWAAQWSSTSVANGPYSLVSVATDADGNTDTSDAVAVTVDNPSPTTTVVLPGNDATLSGSQYLDATASAGVTQVLFELSGGPADLNDQVIADATLTYVGWADKWATGGIANGTYTLNSVASYANGVSGTSPGITITLDN